MTSIPCIAMMLTMIIGSIYISTNNIVPIWVLPISLLASIILPWIYWGIKITDWRLWAFENVRNVHELKKRAIQENLIYKDNSLFGKTEIWTKTKREKWAILNEKFSQKDIFIDDITIPNETVIYISKGKSYTEMFFMFICFLIGIFLILKTKDYILGSISCLFGGYLSFTNFKKATNTEPQIILSNKGIETITAKFATWSDISDEEVIREGYGKSTKSYLTFKYPYGIERINIEDLETDSRTLNKLLRVYRGRHTNQV